MAQIPLSMMVPVPTSVYTPCSPACDGTCAPCPLGSQAFQLLWLVAMSCRTTAGGSPLPADNAKAYFKRAKAHAAVWNEREAREDFLRVAHLDPSMAAAVKKELKQLGERMRKKHVEDRKHYQGLFQPPRGPQASEGQERREVGNGVMLQEQAPQGEVGVLEISGEGEQGAGAKEAEQPGADHAEQGATGSKCEGAAPGGDAAQGQLAGTEVEARSGTELWKEASLGTCEAEPESWRAEGGAEEEDEKAEEAEEEGEEEEEEGDEVEKEGKVERKEEKVEDEEGKVEREEEKMEDEEGKVEREEEKVEDEEEEVEREEEKVEDEEGKVEKKKEKVEDEEEIVEKEEEKVKESPAAEMEKLAVGQCRAVGQTEAVGLRQGAGTRSMAGAEPGRVPGPRRERLGSAEGPPEPEDETPREALEEGSCRNQRADHS